MGSFAKLKKLFEEEKNISLICHLDPDGDAVGSLLAIGQAMEGQNKNLKLISKDPIPSVFKFLSSDKEILSEFNFLECDVLVLLDNGDCRRTGFVQEIESFARAGGKIINIDHHPKNDLWKIATVNQADIEACSTCEIVYKLLIGLNFPIDSRIATYLLAGIFNDTGGFRHANTTPAVLQIVADLLKRGAKLKKIAQNIENTQPVSKFKLWGIALDRLRVNKKYGISVSYLTKEDLVASEASEDEVAGLVNLVNCVPDSRASLLLYESCNGKIKGSLRTDREDIDLCVLANWLCGGGHKKASGFALSGKIVQDEKGKWKVI